MKSLLLASFLCLVAGCGTTEVGQVSPANDGTAKEITPNRAKPEETVTVLVAQRDIEIGTVFTKPQQWLKEKQYPKGRVPANAMTHLDEGEDYVLIMPLKADQPLLGEMLVQKENRGSTRGVEVESRLPVEIPLEDELGVDANTLYNSRVGLLFTCTDPLMNPKLILNDVHKLVIVPSSDRLILSPTTVTLALNQREADIIDLATRSGTLRLVLREKEAAAR